MKAAHTSGTASFNADVSQRPAAPSAGERIASVDVLRGIAVVLMAIDHVRVYAGVPAGGPTPGLFFTRWITHFVAPVFVFLAGTAAFLHAQKLGSKKALAKFLLVRGALLIALELTVVRFAWTFNLDFASYVLLGPKIITRPNAPPTAVGRNTRAASAIMLHPITQMTPQPGRSIHPSEPRVAQGSIPWAIGYFAFEIGDTGPLAVLYSLVPWIA